MEIAAHKIGAEGIDGTDFRAAGQDTLRLQMTGAGVCGELFLQAVADTGAHLPCCRHSKGDDEQTAHVAAAPYFFNNTAGEHRRLP